MVDGIEAQAVRQKNLTIGSSSTLAIAGEFT